MRVIIVVDNGLTAEAIRREMRHAPSFQVMGSVNGRGPCAMAVADAAPDLVVMDAISEEWTTLSRIREVRDAVPEAKIVLLTARMDAGWLADATAAGADAAIAKSAPPESLGILIREVAAGNVFHTFARPSPRRRGPPCAPQLTARELEILRWVAAGASNGAIAQELFISEQTIKFHLSNVYRKLGVSNRTQASHIAYHHGLLEAPSHDSGAGDSHVPVAA